MLGTKDQTGRDGRALYLEASGSLQCSSTNNERYGAVTTHVHCLLIEGHSGPHYCAAPHREWFDERDEEALTG